MKKIPVRHIAEKEQASAGKFNIRSVEALLDGKDLYHDLHRHDFFFILALQNGKGIHEIDFTPYKVVNNTVFCIRPGQVHQLQLKAGCSGYLMEFSDEFYHPVNKVANQRLRKASSKNFCQPGINSFKKLQALLHYIFQEYSNQQEGYLDIIQANLDIFFIELLRQSQNSNDSSPNANQYTQQRLEEFLELLEDNITTHKQVSQYTGLMNLSPFQLNEITKTTLGKTASELINEHIILEAKRYLLASTNQVNQIADQLGYEDISYFTRFFKKHTGHTPEQFRQNFR